MEKAAKAMSTAGGGAGGKTPAGKGKKTGGGGAGMVTFFAERGRAHRGGATDVRRRRAGSETEDEDFPLFRLLFCFNVYYNSSGCIWFSAGGKGGKGGGGAGGSIVIRTHGAFPRSKRIIAV